MADWQQPRKQSAFGIFMFAGKAFREIIAVALVIIGSFARKEKPVAAWLLAFGGIGLYIFGKAFLEYFYFSFQVTGDQLIVRRGIFSKKTLVIPFERIQTVQLHQNLLHRLIGHCKVSIDTAGSEKTEVSIQSLGYRDANELKELLTRQGLATATGETSPVVAGTNAGVIRLSATDLLKIAISANHLETFGLLAAFVLARFEDVKDLLGFNAYDWVEAQGSTIAFTTQMIGGIVFLALLISIVISFLRIVLKFSDLTIQLTGKGFQLKHGLLQSQQQFIGTRKIQFIEWTANWVRRKLGICLFHIKTVGETDQKKKQRIYLPVTREAHLEQLSGYYQQDRPSAGTEAGFIRKAYVLRTVLFKGVPFTIFLTAIAWFWWGIYSLLVLITLVYFIITTIIYRRNFRVWVNNDAIQIEKGVWGRQELLLKWQKIQVVTIRQSPYQRRKTLANLVLHTAAGAVEIPYLALDEAALLADHAMMQIERSQENWM
ncbi:MAG TPA: PH domain-containing protein [Chitinophagaceae bacterium]